MAIYIGWLMHGVRGGIIAGGLFVLPGLICIMALSYIYAGWGHVGPVAALFFGLKAAVLAVVVQAVVRVGSRAMKNRAMLGIAAATFVCIFFVGIPFPLIIIIAVGLLGWLGTRAGSTLFQIGGGHGGGSKGLAEADSLLGEDLPAHAQVTAARAWKVAALWGALWLAPVVALLLTLGPDATFTRIALFFTEMAVVTFGGAYAVLAYVAQQAVEHYHWLRPGEMLDGLGMAETTPGPLIMVTQFVGFMAAYRDPGFLHPMLAGTLGGLLTTWLTFTPCFLWIFLGAPFIERLPIALLLAPAPKCIVNKCRIRRMDSLCVGIPPLHRLRWRHWRPGRLLTRETIRSRMPDSPAQGGRDHQNGGRLEIGTVGAIKSERWAPSNRNRWAAYVGIRNAWSSSCSSINRLRISIIETKS